MLLFLIIFGWLGLAGVLGWLDTQRWWIPFCGIVATYVVLYHLVTNAADRIGWDAVLLISAVVLGALSYIQLKRSGASLTDEVHFRRPKAQPDEWRREGGLVKYRRPS